MDDQKRPVGVGFLVAFTVEQMDTPVRTATAVDEQPQSVPAVGIREPAANGLSEVDFLPAAMGVLQGN